MLFTLSLILVSLVCISIFFIDRRYVTNPNHSKLKLPFPKWLPAKYNDSILIFIVSFLLIFLFNNHKFVIFNCYSHMAQSLLQGRLDIPNLPVFYESVTYKGRIYLQVPPGPVLFVLPFVALFGLSFNINILSILLGAANIVLFYNLLKRFNLTHLRTRLWLTALFGFGTVHFYLAAIGYSWFLAQLGGTFFLLLALWFLLDPAKFVSIKNSFLPGFFWGLAVSCRISLLAAGLFFVVMIWRSKHFRWQKLLYFFDGAIIPGGLYMLFNYLRYDTVMDIGYQLFYRIDATSGNVYDLRNVPFNLYALLLMLPEVINKFPYIGPISMHGIAITYTTPALFFAVKAKGDKWLIRLLWLTIFVCAIPYLVNTGVGAPQVGMRYALDFIPFLMLLTAIALREITKFSKVLILWSIWVGAWSILYWNFFR